MIYFQLIPGFIDIVWSNAKWWLWESNVWNMGATTALYDHFERHRTQWEIKGKL